MSFGNFVLDEIRAQSNGMFAKMQEVCGSKVKIIKAFLAEPKYVGNEDTMMWVEDDGTKGCFMFNGIEQARKFAKLLTNELDVPTNVVNYIGYGAICVPVDAYEETIRKGLNMLLDFNDGWWLDIHNRRAPREYEQVLCLTLDESYFDKTGNIRKIDEVVIKTWVKSLERLLGQKILVDEHFQRTVNLGIVRAKDAYLTHDAVLDKIRKDERFRRTVNLGIVRTKDAYLTHDSVLNKIRKSDILTNSPFDGYAYVDYYGRAVQ